MSHLFGSGGGAKVAAELGVPLLGELPLDAGIRERVDGGEPSVVSDPDGAAAAIYRDVARHMAARLWALDAGGGDAPVISMDDD